MTLSDILDAVLLNCGLTTLTAYAGATDDAELRLLYLANRSAAVLSQYPYQALRETYSFTLTSDTEYPLPDDFRAFLPDTAYGDSRLWPMDLPTSKEYWRWLKSSDGGTGVRVKARILGDEIHIHQPESGEEITIEYLSNAPVQDADGITNQQRFDADTDTWRLDDDLIIMDLVWRYKKLLTLGDWQVDFQDFKKYEMIYRGQEAGSQTISPSPRTQGEWPYFNRWRPVPNT